MRRVQGRLAMSPENGIGTFHSPTGDFTQSIAKVDGLMPDVIYPYHKDVTGNPRWMWRYRRRPGTAEYDFDPLPDRPHD